MILFQHMAVGLECVLNDSCVQRSWGRTDGKAGKGRHIDSACMPIQRPSAPEFQPPEHFVISSSPFRIFTRTVLPAGKYSLPHSCISHPLSPKHCHPTFSCDSLLHKHYFLKESIPVPDIWWARGVRQIKYSAASLVSHCARIWHLRITCIL